MSFCQCWVLHILLSDLQRFPLRPVSLSRQCNVFARVSHSHKNSNTSYIPVGDPSTKTLPSGHHKYASHTCCIQAYSAAALGLHRFLSCGQRVRLELLDAGFHCAATPPSEPVSKSLKIVVILRVMFDSEGIHQAIYIVAEHKVIFLSEERHQLLMTAKRRNSDNFLEKIPLFKS